MTGGALIGGYATGLPVQMPMIDIQEVGTGGGSIARVEMGDALHVGPESAGAQPGPVCYGRGGTEPTITDANLVLGRLAADRFLGGEMRLDVEGARRRARNTRRRAARPRSHCGGRRHSAHRHHQNVPHGALGDHRTRSRRSRVHARRLWWRRAAPRGNGGARAAHRPGRHPARARAISRPTECWSRISGAISSIPGSRRWPRHRLRPWKTFYAEMERRGREAVRRERHRRRRHRRAARGRHALCRAGARRHRRASGRAVPDRGSRRYQEALRCRARDALRLFGAGRKGRDREPAHARSPA